MISINQIATGFFNNLLDKEDDLYMKRIAICKDCSLYKIDNIFGAVCNSTLYVNTKTGETSRRSLPGFKNGCNCILRSKTRVKEATCPLNR